MTNNRQFSKGHKAKTLTRALLTLPSDRDAAFRAIELIQPRSAKPVNPRAGILPVHPAVAALPPYPADDSATTAAELVQSALAAVHTDAPLPELPARIRADGNPLDGLADVLKAPTDPESVFRFTRQGNTNAGPMISQFLLRPFEAGSLLIDHKHRPDLGLYGYSPAAVRGLLDGVPIETQVTGSRPAYIHSLRMLASAMRRDPPYLYGLHALMLLDSMGVPRSSLAPALPAEAMFTWGLGQLDLQCLMVEAVRHAMSICWQQKWQAGSDRRGRPEEVLATPERLHPIWAERGAPLLERHGLGPHLPLLSAAGAPAHPSDVSGHSVIGGAVATVIKAGYADMPWPMQMLAANSIGTELVPVRAVRPRVHSEADKLAENFGWGRVVGGLHYASDVRRGMILGEAAAVEVLQRAKRNAETLGMEPWGEVTFRGFFGRTHTI
jgi:hypothetical protein